jgi:hypothetical protein
MTEADLIERAEAFVAAVAAAEPREIIEAFCARDVVQEKSPNLLRPNGAVRDSSICGRLMTNPAMRSLKNRTRSSTRWPQVIALCWKRSGMRRWLLVSANSRLVTGCVHTLRRSSNSGTV